MLEELFRNATKNKMNFIAEPDASVMEEAINQVNEALKRIRENHGILITVKSAVSGNKITAKSARKSVMRIFADSRLLPVADDDGLNRPVQSQSVPYPNGEGYED